MRICDRCSCPNPKYHNIYICGIGRDICNECNRKYEKLTEVFDSMEREFMENKTLKHIDSKWEDAR